MTELFSLHCADTWLVNYIRWWQWKKPEYFCFASPVNCQHTNVFNCAPSNYVPLICVSSIEFLSNLYVSWLECVCFSFQSFHKIDNQEEDLKMSIQRKPQCTQVYASYIASGFIWPFLNSSTLLTCPWTPIKEKIMYFFSVDY